MARRMNNPDSLRLMYFDRSENRAVDCFNHPYIRTLHSTAKMWHLGARDSLHLFFHNRKRDNSD